MLRPFSDALRKAGERRDDLASAFIGAHEKNLALVQRLERRQRLYDARTMTSRIGIFVELMRRGDYSQRHDWGLGSRALVADLTRGVLHGGARQDR